MKVKKLNIKRLAIFLAVCLCLLIFIIVGVIKITKNIKYKNSYEYKLIEIGYKDTEAKELSEKLSSKQLDKLLSIDYNSNISKLIKRDHFIFSKLDDYLTMIRKSGNVDLNNVIIIVNVKGLGDWYDEIENTNMSKGEKIIVNKKYRLANDYVPEDLVTLESSYAYSGIKIRNIMHDDLAKLINDAKEAGYKIIVSQGYRSYESQEKLYNNYKEDGGEKKADEVVARPGHSEYQTGLSIDIEPYNKKVEDYKTNEEYLWLKDNCYKYGFIMRFPEDTEYITGFKSSPWRYRYVGVNTATKVHKLGITYDEYYEYYEK